MDSRFINRNMRAQIQNTISIADLIDAKENISPLFTLALLATPPARIDFSRDNPHAKHIDIAKGDLQNHITETLKKSGSKWGYGGWGEDRTFYESEKGERRYRAIHLGIDIWLPEGTSIHTPMTGTIHSFKHNTAPLSNGPTIVTEHAIDGIPLWILYGNLSKDSLGRLREGATVRSGDQVGSVGGTHENGGWPSHVHVQIVSDIGKNMGHFPAYAKHAEKEHYLLLCPNPVSLIAPFLVG